METYDLASRDMNLLVETLRRNNYKVVDIHNIICTAWGPKAIGLRRVQMITKEFQEGERLQFERSEGSGRRMSALRAEQIISRRFVRKWKMTRLYHAMQDHKSQSVSQKQRFLRAYIMI